MSAPADAAPGFWRAVDLRLRRALPAPFGWHTRHMLREYARHALMALSALITIALLIDLTFFLGKVLAAAPEAAGWRAAAHLVWYMTLRSADFLAELLPLACFLGVLWCEINQTLTRERVIVWLSGRTPLQCLTPILLFGVAIGAAQLALNIWLRPAAVMTQAAAGLGAYGERFSRALTAQTRWLTAGQDLIEARILFAGPELRDLRLYRMDAAHRLVELIDAESAAPAPDGRGWVLRNGWRAPVGANAFRLDDPAAAARPPQRADQRFAEAVVDIKVDPRWLATLGINARYLRDATFRGLRNADFPSRGEYRTWAHARYAMSFFTAGMALLASCLALLLIPYRLRLWPLLLIALVGYAAHILMKLFLVLGDHDRIAPSLAAWGAPAIVMAAGPIILLIARRRDISRHPLGVVSQSLKSLSR
jgi:lipopolysaccharide export LptBFGC system permease protein LptF